MHNILCCPASYFLFLSNKTEGWLGNVREGERDYSWWATYARDTKQQRNELKTNVCDVSQWWESLTCYYSRIPEEEEEEEEDLTRCEVHRKLMVSSRQNETSGFKYSWRKEVATQYQGDLWHKFNSIDEAKVCKRDLANESWKQSRRKS